ncbi:MAG: glycine oxidase ThiO [Gammaproteobacteria bacterium]|nr:glycine oxidase ThiO [Gammaproteobacteria bacterium]
MTDCIIVGGGLIGMLSARELKKKGLNVLILEKGEMGKEASWAGGGILSPLHPWQYPDEVNQLASIGHQQYENVAETLYVESGVDPEYVRSGMMVLGCEQRSQVIDWSKKWSMNLSIINDATEMQAILPGLHEEFKQGYWMPDIAQMRNPKLVKAVKGSLNALGVPYKENAEVRRLNVVNGRVSGVEVDGKTLHADKVLIAGGAWSGEILKEFEHAPEIKPVKGQMILFKGNPDLLKTIILSENRYLIPRRDGRILCGSSIEHSGFSKATSQSMKEDLLESAISIFPALADLQIEHHWAGLRPGSPQGVPYIGSHHEIEGLYINAGHYRNGVILGLGSAFRIADIMIA